MSDDIGIGAVAPRGDRRTRAAVGGGAGARSASRDEQAASRTGQLFTDPDPPELLGEVRLVRGVDGERLARQQARVLWEVTEWLARNECANGQEQAA